MLLEIAAAAQDYLSEPSPLADQITAAGISTWLINVMKKSNLKQFDWINEHSTIVNRGVSAAFAIVSTSGIHMLWHGNGESVSAGGTFTLVLASGWMGELQRSTWKTLGSYFMQQFATRMFFQHEKGKEAVDTVAEVVKDKKEQIAAVVMDQDTTILKLKEPIRPENRSEPTLEDRPIDWGWFTKK